MGKIGNFNFINITGGRLAGNQPVVNLIDRQGVDGKGFRIEASKSKEITVQTKEKCTSIEIANDRDENYAQLIGTAVDVTDDMGKMTNNVLILDVGVNSVRQVVGSSDIHCKAIVEAVWRLIVMNPEDLFGGTLP